MGLLKNLWARIHPSDDELHEELDAHIEMRAELNEAGGLSPETAKIEARRLFGNRRLIAEDTRHVHVNRLLETIGQDVRHTLRFLARNRIFTVISVLTLAMGIGASTAVFSVVNAVLVRPLPYPDADALTVLWTNFGPTLPENSISGPEFAEMLEFSTLFDGIAIAASSRVTLSGENEAEPVQMGMVSGGFFDVMGARALNGRLLQEPDDVPGTFVATISEGLWQRRFGRDPGVIGTTIYIDNIPAQVIGVVGSDFDVWYPNGRFPREVDVWMPLIPSMRLAFGSDSYDEMPRGFHFLSGIARMKEGVTLAQAQSDMDAVALAIQARSPGDYDFEEWGITVDPLHDDLVSAVRPRLLLLLGAVGFVLLIACVNVGSLTLARAATREREIALRTALGAGSWRVIRQLLTESMVLALTGGVIGVLAAAAGAETLATLTPASVPRGNEVGVDLRVLAFALAASVLTALVFGLAPAFRATKGNLIETLRSGRRSIDAGGVSGAHAWLVAAEVALTVVLLVGAGLMIRTFDELSHTDLGYDPDNLLTFRIDLPEARYDWNQQAAFFEQLLEQLANLSEVQSVGATSALPLGASGLSGTTWVNETTRFAPDEALIEADHHFVTDGYFQAMDIASVRGRRFNAFDTPRSHRVAIVDEEFARRFWPDVDPIGKEVSFDPIDADPQWWEVVGVVEHVRRGDLAAAGREQVYFPARQAASLNSFGGGMYIALKTRNDDPMSLAGPIRNVVREIDPDQPVDRMLAMDARIDGALSPTRFSLLLLAAFASVAMVLALIGVYGLVTYSVTRKYREIGIRMALGAKAREIRSIFVRRSMRAIGVGLTVGLLAAAALSRFLDSMLYNVTPNDPVTYGLSAIGLIVAGLVASYVPATRAANVDPNVALRDD